MNQFNFSYRAIRCLTYDYTKRLDCTPKEIFEIVLNVSDYKKFIPYIKDSSHHLNFDTSESHTNANLARVPVPNTDSKVLKDTRVVTTRDSKGRGIRGIRGVRSQLGVNGPKDSITPGISGTGYGMFTTHWSLYREQLECDLKFKANEYVISSCTNDLFKHLACKWSFRPIKNQLTKQDQCDVEISLDYEFNNFIYNNLSSLFSKQISQIMVKSFEERLTQLRNGQNL